MTEASELSSGPAAAFEAVDPERVRLVARKERAPHPQRLVSPKDVRIALRLLGAAVATRLLPERLWRRMAGAIAGLKRRPSRSERARAAAVAGAVGISAEEGLRAIREIRANRLEVSFQYARGAGWRPDMHLEGGEHIERALAAGRGAILWVAPFVFAGTIAKMCLARHGFAPTHVSSPLHGLSVTRAGVRFLNPVCVRFERHFLEERLVIDRKHPAEVVIRARAALRRNRIVSFTAGAWEGSPLLDTPLPAGRFPFAAGPVVLSRLTGAALLPVFVTREEGTTTFTVRVSAPLLAPQDVERSQHLRIVAAAFASGLGRHILRHPAQWPYWHGTSSAHE